MVAFRSITLPNMQVQEKGKRNSYTIAERIVRFPVLNNPSLFALFPYRLTP